MKRKLADIVTGVRILLAAALLFLPPRSVLFGVLYLLSGLSDASDGAIARKTHTESERGARLDSIADLLFFLVCAMKIVPLVRLGAWIWAWAAGIALIKTAGLLRQLARGGSPMPPHSVSNRLTGVLLFLWPLTIPLADVRYTAAAVCAAATWAAVQDRILWHRARKMTG